MMTDVCDRTSLEGAGLQRAGRFLLLALCLAAAALLAGCGGGRGGPVAYDVAIPPPDVQGEPVADTSAPIGALDTLNVNVFQVESLSGEFAVDQAGAIDFPLLGNVVVQGRTTQELSSHLASRLSERYLQSPQVSVSVKERAQQTVTVDGSVQQPGVFAVKGPTTLMQAVAMARGISEDANPQRVMIFRTVNGERVAGAYDLKAIRTAQAEDPVVYGNDIIIVDGSRARKLFRDLIQSMPLLGVMRPFY